MGPPKSRYFTVQLGRKVHVRVNRAVALAFHGPPPTDAHHAAHDDRDTGNNRAGNLRWATAVENAADKHRHGTYRPPPAAGRKGADNVRAKLQADDVAAIRRRLADGAMPSVLAAEYGMSRTALLDIKHGRTWQ
jgi:hypothetical protein